MPPQQFRHPGLPTGWAGSIAATPTMAALQTTVLGLADAIGFRAPTYGLFIGPRRMLTEGRLISGYPAEWVERYVRGNYAAIDPVVDTGRRQADPFAWDEMPEDLMTERQIAHMNEAADFGVRDGFSVPIRTIGAFGMFAVLADGSAAERAEALRDRRDSVTALALAVHEQARRLCRAGEQQNPLTPREQECVQWLVVGKSGVEIGEILGISELTVTQHIKSAMRKLGVFTRVHLAVRAITLQLVDPE